MNFRLSAHAQQELERRDIPVEIAESVLNNPQQIIEADEGRKAYQSQVEFEGKMYLVRAIVEEGDPVVVVTVYRTSKIKKYWRES
jgi:hypothetical protein